MWHTFQPVLEKLEGVAKQIKSSQYAIYLKDTDLQSDFFFTCNSTDYADKVSVGVKPGWDHSIQIHKVDQTYADARKTLENWLNILK